MPKPHCRNWLRRSRRSRNKGLCRCPVLQAVTKRGPFRVDRNGVPVSGAPFFCLRASCLGHGPVQRSASQCGGEFLPAEHLPHLLQVVNHGCKAYLGLRTGGSAHQESRVDQIVQRRWKQRLLPPRLALTQNAIASARAFLHQLAPESQRFVTACCGGAFLAGR